MLNNTSKHFLHIFYHRQHPLASRGLGGFYHQLHAYTLQLFIYDYILTHKILRFSHLRYYSLKATSHIKLHCPKYKEYYSPKYAEVKTHQHKRALALTARKAIKLIFGLLAKNQLYSGNRVGQA